MLWDINFVQMCKFITWFLLFDLLCLPPEFELKELLVAKFLVRYNNSQLKKVYKPIISTHENL